MHSRVMHSRLIHAGTSEDDHHFTTTTMRRTQDRRRVVIDVGKNIATSGASQRDLPTVRRFSRKARSALNSRLRQPRGSVNKKLERFHDALESCDSRTTDPIWHWCAAT